jgi:hypothetical protein
MYVQIGPRIRVKDLEKLERTVAHPLTARRRALVSCRIFSTITLWRLGYHPRVRHIA